MPTHVRLFYYTINAPADHPAVEDKVNGSFKPAYGSILFFGDNAVVDGWGAQMPAYHGVSPSLPVHTQLQITNQQAFKTWIETSSGMVQHIVWTALTAEGMGASLQVRPLVLEWNVADK